MDDLLSKKEVIKALDAEYRCTDKTDDWDGLRLAISIVEDLPSTQPEIIHCEFCKHWKNEHLCECLSIYGTFETPKDFFCGYGKAK